MSEDLLSNETIQEFLFTTRQKLGSLSDIGPSSTIKESDVDSLKEDLMLVYETLGELKRDCELSLNITEQLFEQKTRSEFEKESVENMNDHIQKLEDENQRIMDYNKALEAELESCKNEMETMENEIAAFDNEKDQLKAEARHAKQGMESHEKRMLELEDTLLEEKRKSENEIRELIGKVQQLEKTLQKTNKDYHDLQRVNEKLSASLIAKQKDLIKLSDDIKRNELEKAKLDEVNTDLKADLDKLIKELAESEQKLKEVQTTAVSDPRKQMARVVSQNLALNSMFMSSPAPDALGLMDKEVTSEATALAAAEHTKSEPEDEPDEEKKVSLEAEIRRSILLDSGKKFVESPEGDNTNDADPFPVFMDYKFDSKALFSGSTEFAAQVDYTTSFSIDTVCKLEIVRLVKKCESGINTEAKMLSSINICNINLQKTRPIVKVTNSIVRIEGITITFATKGKLPAEPKGEAKEESTRKKSLSESVHDVVRKKPLGTFDPLKSFFVLTTQAIILNSPYVNHIGQLDNDNMYIQVQKEQVPFFKWHNWITATINARYARHHRKNVLSMPQAGVKRPLHSGFKAPFPH